MYKYDYVNLDWEEVILYLYKEYDEYGQKSEDEFVRNVYRNTGIESEERVRLILDFLETVELLDYDESISNHPLTKSGFDTGRELNNRQREMKRRQFDKSAQVVIALMTFSLGLSALAQIADTFGLSNQKIGLILIIGISTTVIPALYILLSR